MNTTIIRKPYASFMKEALSFCDTACGKYQIPILLISTRKTAGALLAEVLKWDILVDPAPTGGSLLGALKQDVDQKIVNARLRKLEGTSLLIADRNQWTEADLAALDLKAASIVFIDDLDAVPSVDVLEKWAGEKGVKIIVRKNS